MLVSVLGGSGRLRPAAIVAVGDVHGSFDGLTTILQEAGIIDADLKWAGGDATYIQLGDLFDRGLQVRETVDFDHAPPG